MTDWDRFFDEIYKNSANNPNRWLAHARALKQSADLIFPSAVVNLRLENQSVIANELSSQPIVFPVYFMLAAYAFENLIKGIFTTKFSALDINNSKLNKEIDKHIGLEEILGGCVPLSKEEGLLLKQLEQYAVSWGRYPIPKFKPSDGKSNRVSSADQRLPKKSLLRKKAAEILKDNKQCSYTASPIISNVFRGEIDKNIIDELYSKLEKYLAEAGKEYKPTFSNLD